MMMKEQTSYTDCCHANALTDNRTLAYMQTAKAHVIFLIFKHTVPVRRLHMKGGI